MSTAAWLTVVTGTLLILLMVAILYSVSISGVIYENRNEMNKDRGGLSNELGTVKNAWVIWQAGGATVPIADARLANIERLILCDPTVDQTDYVRRYKAESTENVVNIIRSLSSRALKLGVQVRWHKAPQLSIVINDQGSDSAWARIEVLLPGVESEYRPNIVVKKAIHQDMFRSLVQMFQHEWDDAREALPEDK